MGRKPSGRCQANCILRERAMTKNTNGKHQTDVSRRNILLAGTTMAAASALAASAPMKTAQAQQQRPTAAPSGQRPNILVIFGDDIGQTNLSAYSFGLMGYSTPNIDRIAREGMMFTDYYAEQSCTAGRSSFITGQCTLRTGLSKVGIPGATVGLQARDATLAELLKPLGYATGQFGKNHLGDTQRISADGAWLRRILRQSLSPQRRGRSGDRGPIRAIPRSGRRLVRAACCAARHPIATIRPNSRAGAGSASRPSRTPVRSPKNVWRRSTTKRRPRPSISCKRQVRANTTILLLDQYHAHAFPHPCAGMRIATSRA